MEAYSMALQAYNEKIKDEWERTRKIAFYAVAPYLAKEYKDIEKFMPFKWDTEKQPEEKDITQPDRERFNELTTLLNLN